MHDLASLGKDTIAFLREYGNIPGLIPGASEGKGLGIRFLKHVERTKVIAHLLDLTQLTDEGEEANLEETFDAINAELRAFSPELAERRQMVVLTKLDAVSSDERVEHYRELFSKRGYEVAVISSVAGKGVPELIERLADFAYEAGPEVGGRIEVGVADDSFAGEPEEVEE